jgi:hypothetical protein
MLRYEIQQIDYEEIDPLARHQIETDLDMERHMINNITRSKYRSYVRAVLLKLLF